MNIQSQLTSCFDGAVVKITVPDNVNLIKSGAQRGRSHFLFGSNGIKSGKLPVHVVGNVLPRAIRGRVIIGVAWRELITTRKGNQRAILVVQPAEEDVNACIRCLGSGEYAVVPLR